MNELKLKYGCNPNQTPAKIYMKDNSDLPIEVLNGTPGYINLLDAFNSWQLVLELKTATDYPAACSFKHVSPAGAAIGTPMSETLKKICYVDDLNLTSPMAFAYAKARGADRLSSYGDWVALSDTCDAEVATILKREVSDGIIAPDYTSDALKILKTKKRGNYNIIKIDKSYRPNNVESKDVFGITFEQKRNDLKVTDNLFENVVTKNKIIPKAALIDLIISMITLKYTQSNSVCYVKDGMAIGIGAGQQSRIHCTRLAGNKADIFWLRQHIKVMSLPFLNNITRAQRDNAIDIYISNDYEGILADGCWQQLFSKKPEPLTNQEKKQWILKQQNISLGSDAFFPFGDNIERAHRSGVKYICQPGGSIRDDDVIKTCDKYEIAMAFTKARLFHH
ncbi:MAG: phosphoribosylaminoimidazolecarboxamide formyltransferase [Oscillospiraceae bacterium]|nr:phosphoribosylaminoimidazolecarboxamide formyltransferase [Oscillospiraceae bacterium]